MNTCIKAVALSALVFSANVVATEVSIYDRLYLGVSDFDLDINRSASELNDRGYSLSLGYYLTESSQIRFEYDHSDLIDDQIPSGLSRDPYIYDLRWDFSNYKATYIYEFQLFSMLSAYSGIGLGSWEMSGFIDGEIAESMADSDILISGSQSLNKDSAYGPHVLLGARIGRNNWFVNFDYEYHSLRGEVFDDASLIKIGLIYRLGEGASAFKQQPTNRETVAREHIANKSKEVKIDNGGEPVLGEPERSKVTNEGREAKSSKREVRSDKKAIACDEKYKHLFGICN